VLPGDPDHRESPGRHGGHDHQQDDREAVHGSASLLRSALRERTIPQLERLQDPLH
jgi:hypothetical protein